MDELKKLEGEETSVKNKDERNEIIEHIISKVPYFTSIKLHSFTIEELKTLKSKIEKRSDLV